jgi:hypothetical protein
MKFPWYTGSAHIQTTSISLWLYSSCGPWPVFQFPNLTQLVGLLGRGMSPSQGRYLHTEQHKYRINAHRHPCFEWDSNPVFGGALTVQALDRAATVIFPIQITYLIIVTTDATTTAPLLFQFSVQLTSVGLYPPDFGLPFAVCFGSSLC